MTKDSTTLGRARWWGLGAFALMAAGLLALVLASGGVGVERAFAADPTPTQAAPAPFPTPGADKFESSATIKVTITNPALGKLTCSLLGLTVVERGPVVADTLDSVVAEIVFMKLQGTCHPGGINVTLTESATIPSTGQIVEQKNNTPGTLDFPADSFFNMFVVIDTPGGIFHNRASEPVTVNCKIDAIPPIGCSFEFAGSVPLYNPEENKEVGEIKTVKHVPGPTPTPPDVPVGGIVDEIPDSVSDQLEASGSGSNADVLAGSIAGTVFVIALALSGGAWYLRRRVR